jgi:hypothetical protein
MSPKEEHPESARSGLNLTIEPQKEEKAEITFGPPLFRPRGNAYAYATTTIVPDKALKEILKNRPDLSTLRANNSFYTIMLDLTVSMENPTGTYLDWARFNIEMDEKSKILLVAPDSIEIEGKLTETKKAAINITPTGKVSIVKLAEAEVGAGGYTSESGWTFEAPVNLKKYLSSRTGERTAICELYGHPEHLRPFNPVGESSIAKALITIQIPKGEKPKMSVKAEGQITKENAFLLLDLSGPIELKTPAEIIPA